MAEILKSRPKHLNLFEIKQPVPAVASILHRVAGAALFLMLPVLLYLLGLSLFSAESFQIFRSVIAHPLIKLILFGLIWAYLHHFCMGVRVLLLDIHVGLEKPQARMSAIAVFVVSLALTAVLGVKLW